jgi:hypothetical protein
LSEYSTVIVGRQYGGRPCAGVPGILDGKRGDFKSQYRQLLGQFPDTDAQLKQLFEVVCNIEDVAGYNPASVGGARSGPP